MAQSWQTNPATALVTGAAKNLTLEGAAALPWIASKLIRTQLQGLPPETPSAQLAVHALAACQRAMAICAETPGIQLPARPFTIEDETTRAAMAAITEGANAIGAAGPEGLRILVENVLPPMHQAAGESSGEHLIHDFTTWFLLALSVGPLNQGPDHEVYRGILLAYPIPEQRMVWS